jgi:hypothetical protein
MRPLLLLLALAGCTPGEVKLDDYDDIGSADDVSNICAEHTPETTTLAVRFEATTEGCRWNENGNLAPEDAVVTARDEQTETLDLGDSVVVCDMTFDFAGPDPEVAQVMRYDDNFFLTYDDVVLAASYAPMVERFSEEDGLPVYDWDALSGMEFGFDTSTPTFCLGADEGLSECVIPPPESEDEMTLSFGDELLSQLSYRAIAADRYDFSFITIGDNDPASDCTHEAFEFEVTVPYVQL